MLGAMAADLESLYILGPQDIVRFRNYIAEKYTFQNAAGQAKTLANAIHRVIDKEIQVFSDSFKVPIRTAILDLAVNRGVFQVRGDDIFFTALRLAGFAKDALLALSTWIKTRLGKIVPITALQQMALQLRQHAFINLSKPILPVDSAITCHQPEIPLWSSSSVALPEQQRSAILERALSNLSGLKIPAPFAGLFLLDFLKQLPQKAEIEWPPLKKFLQDSWSNTLGLLKTGLRRFVLPVATASVLCLAAGLSIVSLSTAPIADKSSPSVSQAPGASAIQVIPSELSQPVSVPVWNEFKTKAPEKAPTKTAARTGAVQGEASRPSGARNSSSAIKTAPAAAAPKNPSVQSAQPKSTAANNNLAKVVAYHSFEQKKLRAYLKSKGSLLANEPYFSSIISVSRQHNLNPLLLFAIAGQEQALVPEGSSDAALIANNPFNVFGSWLDYNTSINDSANIAANTIISLSKGRPANADPLAWINRKYASDPNWYKGVWSFLQDLEKAVK